MVFMTRVLLAGGVFALSFFLVYRELESSAPEIAVTAPIPVVQATSTAVVQVAKVETVSTTTVSEVKPVSLPAVPTTKKASVFSASAPVPPIASVPLPTQADFEAASGELRSALVNIFCLSESSVRSISGSGVLIDSRGIVLTNAHIAQYFLLERDKDLGISCSIRTGSPARSAYEAELIFISPTWINANPSTLKEYSPKGNGEYDYALLGITKSTTASPLPESFPFVPLRKESLKPQLSVVIGSYAAQFLSSEAIWYSLAPTIVYGSVKDVYTYASATPDVVALGGTAAAQEGSSGGGVVDAAGDLLGLITTSTIQGNTSERSLYAITTSYLKRAYLGETGNRFDTIFDRPISDMITEFTPEAQALKSLIKY